MSVLILPPRPAAALVVNCQISTTSVNFGSYDPGSRVPTDAVGNIQVRCSLLGLASTLVSYTVTLSPGLGGTYAPRQLVSGTNQLSYNLYTDAARTQVWGDLSVGTSLLTGDFLLQFAPVTRNHPIYGRITALQNVPAGTYSDTITVTVDY